MDSIVLEYQSGLEWGSLALLRAVATVRRIGHRDLEIVCMTSGTRNVGNFMTAGGN